MSDRAISDILASVLGKNFVATLEIVFYGRGSWIHSDIYFVVHTTHFNTMHNKLANYSIKSSCQS